MKLIPIRFTISSISRDRDRTFAVHGIATPVEYNEGYGAYPITGIGNTFELALTNACDLASEHFNPYRK